MYAAVVHRLLHQQDSAAALAGAMGCTVFEARTMLAASATPAIVAVDFDPAVVERHAAALRKAGFGAEAVPVQVPEPKRVRTWLLTDGFEVDYDGSLRPLPYPDIRSVIVSTRRAVHSYTTVGVQPTGQAALRAGPRAPVLPERVETVHNSEQQLRVATLTCADGRVLQIDEVDSRPSNTGAFPTRATAFNYLLDGLRRAEVPLDERLRNRGAQQRVLRPPLTPDKNLDLAVHLVGRHIAGDWTDSALVAVAAPARAAAPRPTPIPDAAAFAAQIDADERPRRRLMWGGIIVAAVVVFLAGSPEILERLNDGPQANAKTPFVVSVIDGTSKDARRIGTEHLPSERSALRTSTDRAGPCGTVWPPPLATRAICSPSAAACASHPRA